MIPSGSLVAPRRQQRPPSERDVASFAAAKTFLDGALTDATLIEKVSDSLIEQLILEKNQIAQEVWRAIRGHFHPQGLALFGYIQHPKASIDIQDFIFYVIICPSLTTFVQRIELEQNVPAQIESSLDAAKDTSLMIRTLAEELSGSIAALRKREKQVDPIALKLKALVDQAKYVQNAGNYVRLVNHVGELITQMEQNLHHLNQRKPYAGLLQRTMTSELTRKAQEKSDGSKLVKSNEFDKVSDLLTNGLLVPLLKLLEISTSLRKVDCKHLKALLVQNIGSLSSRTQNEFSALYSASLETLKWPISMAEATKGTFNEFSLHFFRTSLVLLVKLQQSIQLYHASIEAESAQSDQVDVAASSNTPDAPPMPAVSSSSPLWCMDLLVKPLEIRFNFNFRGRESTNRYDRPEWHFTYVRQLLKNHEKFLEFVTSVLHSLGLYFDARHEVLRGLIPLINEKLQADLRAIIASGGAPSGVSSDFGTPVPFAKLGSLVMGGSGFLGVSGSIASSSANLTHPSSATQGGRSTVDTQNQVAPLLGAAAAGPNRHTVASSTHELSQALLSHTINEILDFEKTLTDVFGYPQGRHNEGYPRPIDVLTIPEWHEIWLDLEVGTLKQHIKAAMDAPDAWERQYATVPVSEDQYRVPRHCFLLFNVLSILQERYSLLGPGREEDMSEFLEAQLSILGDYLDKMKELQSTSLRSLDGVAYLKQCCVLYNAAWYARKSLEDWCTQSVYTDLYLWNKGINDPELLNGTVFDSLIQQCKALCKHNIKLMSDKSLQIFTNACSKSYLRTNFLEDLPEPTSGDIDISPLLCDPLFLLREAVAKVENSLNTTVFRKYWRTLAASTNSYILESIILKKHFHSRGAMQLKADFNAILLVWRNYTSAPEGYFKETHEAIHILNLPLVKMSELGKLASSLTRTDGYSKSRSEFAAYDIYQLTANQVQQVIARHIDKKTTR